MRGERSWLADGCMQQPACAVVEVSAMRTSGCFYHARQGNASLEMKVHTGQQPSAEAEAKHPCQQQSIVSTTAL